VNPTIFLICFQLPIRRGPGKMKDGVGCAGCFVATVQFERINGWNRNAPFFAIATVRRGRGDEAKLKKQRPTINECGESEGRAMVKTVHGTVHGKTIALDEDLGVAEGQKVEVQVKIIQPDKKWGEGILRTAGALADDPYWDAIMEEIHQARKVERRPQGELE